jgi:hypothetical protein
MMVFCHICLKFQNGDLASREKEKLNSRALSKLEQPNFLNFDRLILCTDCWKNVKGIENKKIKADSCREKFF